MSVNHEAQMGARNTEPRRRVRDGDFLFRFPFPGVSRNTHLFTVNTSVFTGNTKVNTSEDFVNTLERWREALAISKEAAAKLIGVSRSYYTEVENRKRDPGKVFREKFEIAKDNAARAKESPPRFASSAKPARETSKMVRDVTYESTGEERDCLAEVLKEISQECDVAQLEKMLLRIAKSNHVKSPAREEAMERLSAEIRAKSKT